MIRHQRGLLRLEPNRVRLDRVPKEDIRGPLDMLCQRLGHFHPMARSPAIGVN